MTVKMSSFREALAERLWQRGSGREALAERLWQRGSGREAPATQRKRGST